MATSHSEDHTYPPSKKNESVAIVNDVNSVSLRQALEYCLDVLKIKDNSEIYRNITKYVKKSYLTFVKTHGNWITAMMIIADCSRKAKYSRNNNSHTFSQSQLYDFLTLATKIIEEEKGEQKRIGQVNNIILKIKDIMENSYMYTRVR
ncbi:MAG TPA: hypothetical protein VFD60_08170 [Nitrososphaeraceae archaeon]|jgi:hypothetical protein|nr:hypothetical protein [Nitrososphaeraceae archaeon]